MARLSMSILTIQDEESDLYQSAVGAAQSCSIGATIISSPYNKLLKEIEEWSLLPEIVLFDVPRKKEVFEVINDLTERFPEGDVDLILTGVPNDIMTYRTLKRLGISEIFPHNASQEEIEAAINEIATRELKATEIDPRRAVYVWGSSGGCGSTTVALAFAKYLSRSEQRTLFIDMDIFSAPASFMFSAKDGAQETYGFIEGLTSPQRIDTVFLERAIQRVEKNLFYLSARKKPGDKNFDPEALSVIVARAQKNFDVVVVDTPWRPMPLPDWGKVNGTSFIVASPSASSYIGFTTIAKELAATASKAPVYGILNKSGEFKSGDFTAKMFGDDLEGEIYSIPYDAGSVGKIFFNQTTLLEAGGKISKPLSQITSLLPKKGDNGRFRNKSGLQTILAALGVVR